MKKCLLSYLTVLLFFCGMVSVSDALPVLVDFDTSPVGTFSSLDTISTEYSSLGVTFTGFENGSEVPVYVDDYWGSSPGDGMYLTNYTPSSVFCCETDRRDVISLTFDNATSDIAFDYFDGWNIDVTFNVYDGSDIYLGGLTASGATNWNMVDLTAYNDVYRIDILQGGDGYTYGLDNLRFDSTPAPVPVPEPITILMLGSGLAILGFVRRKFRK